MNPTPQLSDTPAAPPAPQRPGGAMLAELPLWMPIAAGVPLMLCMAIMGLPSLSDAYAPFFRGLYLCAYVVWVFPLIAAQRSLWRRGCGWLTQSLLLLALSYAMSLVNSALGMLLAVRLGLHQHIVWGALFVGLDSCWLALIAFCAIHAVVAHTVALARAQARAAEALALARDAELRALRYQVHPHFLFNTLNAISALVAGERKHDATRMIAQLADFLRATLDAGNCHEHTLADELALTEGYLDIEKARLGERLRIGIHIGPDVLQAMVPYLILQPLVENAIRHGIALRSAPGRLDLHIARDGETLRIRLDNDGPGDADAAGADARAKGGLGLNNVSERLAKLYGDAQRCTLSAGPDGRYRVDIALPLRAAASQPWARQA